MKVFARILLLLIPVSLCPGQEHKPLTTDDLIQMKKAGLDDGTTIAAIQANGVTLDSSAQGLITLKTAGLSDAVINAALTRISPSIKTGLKIQDGTPVRLILTEDLSSAVQHQNDVVRLETADDIKVDDQTVIPKGSIATGHVIEAAPKGRWGKSGRLEFSADYVKATDGANVRLRSSSGKGTGQLSGGAMVLGLTGAFVKGKEAVFPKGTFVNAFVDGDRQVLLPRNSEEK